MSQGCQALFVTASNPYSSWNEAKAVKFISYAISLSLFVSEGEINSELAEIVNKTLIPLLLFEIARVKAAQRDIPEFWLPDGNLLFEIWWKMFSRATSRDSVINHPSESWLLRRLPYSNDWEWLILLTLFKVFTRWRITPSGRKTCLRENFTIDN